MTEKPTTTKHSPGGKVDDDVIDDEMVNDSLGTTVPSDSTGSDETKETGDAKKNNKPTRED